MEERMRRRLGERGDSILLLPKVLEIRREVPRLRHVIVAGGQDGDGVLSLE